MRKWMKLEMDKISKKKSIPFGLCLAESKYKGRWILRCEAGETEGIECLVLGKINDHGKHTPLSLSSEPSTFNTF